MKFPVLFSQKNIGTMTLKNRIVMPAMGVGLANPDGTVSEAMIEFYKKRAEGGVGLIITEVTMVNGVHGRHNPQQIAAFDDMHIPGLTKLADSLHNHGTKLFLQLYHPGNQTFCDLVGGPLRTPSGIESRVLHQASREMTVEEIKDLVNDFAAAAARAKKAGVDGVEIHAAHGYLLNEFLSPYTNKRTDLYGGDMIKRARIIQELITAIRNEVGRDYPVTMRITADEFLETAGIKEPGLGLLSAVKIVKHLVPFGLDAISVSSGIYDTQNTAWEPTSYPQGWRLYLAETIKEAVDVPVIAVSVIREPEFAEKILKKNVTDFVGIARGHLADPEWGKKAMAGRTADIRKCISCLHCMESLSKTNHTECAVNARSHHELEYGPLKENGNGRKVVVVGAGPSGMEACRVLALRGFKPVLFEQSETLGGQLNLASAPPYKEKLLWLIDYYAQQFRLLNVDVRFNTKATAEIIAKEAPEAVFLATGSVPIVPRSIPGIDGEHVYTTTDIISGKVTLFGKQVVVIGAGMTGLETAEMLGIQGNMVSVVEMLDEIGSGIYIQNLMDVIGRLQSQHARFFPSHKLLKIEADGIIVENQQTGDVKQMTADAVVLSLGIKADTSIHEEVLSAYPNAVLIGDAGKAGRIASAVHSGYKAASSLA